jgi:hypothetical protein
MHIVRLTKCIPIQRKKHFAQDICRTRICRTRRPHINTLGSDKICGSLGNTPSNQIGHSIQQWYIIKPLLYRERSQMHYSKDKSGGNET